MTQDEQHISALVAACAKETSAHILAYARDAGLDPPSFLVSVAAVLASAALAAQPEDQRLAASRHIQHALGLVHCLGDAEDAAAIPPDGFATPEALQ
jgi:hypothetical protein